MEGKRSEPLAAMAVRNRIVELSTEWVALEDVILVTAASTRPSSAAASVALSEKKATSLSQIYKVKD